MLASRQNLSALLPLLLCCLFLVQVTSVKASSSWRTGGGNLNNDRYAEKEKHIKPSNVANLKLLWTYDAGAPVPATPTILDNAMYLTSLDGYVHRVNINTKTMVWKRSVPSLLGLPNLISRTSAAISKDGKTIVIGTQPTFAAAPFNPGAYVVSLNATNGNMHWKKLVDTHYAAWITASPLLLDDGSIYVGVSSNEEYLGPVLGCCTFIGSVAKLQLSDGTIKWSRPMLPDNKGNSSLYSGAAVWGSTPAYDKKTQQIYITTGNTYTVPQVIEECEINRLNSSDPANYPSCIVPDNHMDSIVAINDRDGSIAWAKAVAGLDTWNFGCGLPQYGIPGIGNSCPSIVGPDFDFGQAPLLVYTKIDDEMMLLAIAGQKSGIVWAVRADGDCASRGKVVWNTWVCPGGANGGMIWGSASDGKNVYVACANSERKTWTLSTKNITTNAGVWASLDVKTGAIKWETIDPAASDPSALVMLAGAVTVANGIVFGGTSAASGNMCALNAETGQILFNFSSNATVVAGPAIVDGKVYWPSGYNKGAFQTGSKVFVFGL